MDFKIEIILDYANNSYTLKQPVKRKMSTISPKKMKVIKANSDWYDLYEKIPEKKEKKISFVESEMKVNSQTECKCNFDGFLNCDLHDGSDFRNKKFYKLVQNYFANIKLFDENALIKYLEGNIELVAFCIEQVKEALNRLERRKKELFETELYECYIKKCMPRVVSMEDFDPKWDNIYLDLAASKKQTKHTKVSLVKGGSRGLDGSLEYDHIPYIKRLHNLLENAHEAMFLEFILVC